MLEYSRANRTHLLAVITLLIIAVFVVRLFYLQVVRHEHYLTLASTEQRRELELKPVRGEIYAMSHGKPVKLVLNETIYTAWVDPQSVDEPDKIAAVLRRVAGGNVRPEFEKSFERKDTRYQVLARNLSYKQAEMIKKEKLRGLGFERGERRVYPEGQLASQTLGFVNTEGKGQYGVEGYFDEQLKGKSGLLNTVVDVRDVPLTIGRDNIYKPAENGKNIVLTIDRNIQTKAEQVLAKGMSDIGAKYGSMVVMDPNTGKVMAMANMPTYDPSKFNEITDISVLNNRVVSRPYEPASVMKVMTMATGIDKGVINANSTFTNTDYTTVGDITISNATKGKLGPRSMQYVLTWSLNTGTVEVARWLGGGTISRQARDTMYEYFHDKFRLGQVTGIEVAGEARGVVIPPSDPEGNAPRYANMTFGHGLNVTPLQVAGAFATTVNGGVYHAPTLVEGTMSADGTLQPAAAKFSEQVIAPGTSDTIRDMTRQARQEFYAGNDRPGYAIGGKTGSAQTIENGKYIFDTIEGTYVGYGGEIGEKPSYVILLTFLAPGVQIGGERANPAFTEMSNWMIDYLKLQPKG